MNQLPTDESRIKNAQIPRAHIHNELNWPEVKHKHLR
jgi:hypothetical protein